MFDINKVVNKLLIRMPVLKQYMNNISIIESKKVRTASTSGTVIFYNTDYFLSITNDEQLFTLAHEFLHILL